MVLDLTTVIIGLAIVWFFGSAIKKMLNGAGEMASIEFTELRADQTVRVMNQAVSRTKELSKLKDKDFIKSEKEIDYEIRSELAKIAVEKVKKEYPEKLEQFPALKEQFQSWENRINSSEIIINYPEYQQIFADILEHQRMWLINKNREELLLDEEIVRKHLRLIDLQEERLSLGK